MITGDHPITAAVIAKELGIGAGAHAVTGAEIERAADDSLAETVRDVSVYARVNPEHKLRIVRALQRHGAIVAMTGDGVNDAPALKTADIGIAMLVSMLRPSYTAARLEPLPRCARTSLPFAATGPAMRASSCSRYAYEMP